MRRVYLKLLPAEKEKSVLTNIEKKQRRGRRVLQNKLENRRLVAQIR